MGSVTDVVELCSLISSSIKMLQLCLLFLYSLISSSQSQNLKIKGSTWIVRFQTIPPTIASHHINERQGNFPITKRFLADTDITNNIARTTISRLVLNPNTQVAEYKYSVEIPTTAVLTKIKLNGEVEIVDNPIQRSNIGVSTVGKCGNFQRFVQFTALITLPPNEDVWLNVTYEETILKRSGIFKLQQMLSPGEVVQELSSYFSIQHDGGVRNMSLKLLSPGPGFGFVDYGERDVLFSMTAYEQAKYGEEGLQGVLQLVFSNVEDEYGSSFVSENANFIHTITIPDTMNYLPQHLVLVLPRKSNANGKGFVQKFILECSEMIKPWGQLTIRRQKRPKLWSTHEIRDMYKSGFINTVIQFVNKTQTYRVFITTEDLERTIIDLDAFDKESLMSIIKEIGDITVIKDLSLNYTHGVQNQTTTKTKFNFVKAKDEIKIAGLLDFSSSESIEKVSFNLTGYTENGQLNEHVTVLFLYFNSKFLLLRLL